MITPDVGKGADSIVETLNTNIEANGARTNESRVTDMKEVIDDLRSRYREWAPLNDLANTGKWELLGSIYEASTLVDSEGPDRNVLVAEVTKNPSIDAGRWKAGEKTGHDLFLTLLFGNDRKRSTKSQWKKALTRAEAAGVARTQASFVKYMRERSGISGPAKTTKTNVLERIKEWANSMPSDDADPVVIPMPIGAEDLEGLVITISRVDRGRVGEGDYLAYPIASTADPAAISAFIDGFRRQISVQEKDVIKEANAEQRQKVIQIHKTIKARHRKEWTGAKKRKTTKLSLLQFSRDLENLDPFSKDIPPTFLASNFG